MHPLVKGALGVAVLSVAGIFIAVVPLSPSPAPATVSASGSVPAPAVLKEMPCPPRHLPEGQACIPLPDLGEVRSASAGVHRDRSGRGPTYEVIPRKPDRPRDAGAYSFPLDDEPLFLRGFDATLPSDASPVSVELSAERGTPVRIVVLEAQEGAARVAAVGRFIGTTVVTRHLVRAPDRSYLLVFGHLEAAAPDVRPGADLGSADVLGFMGDSGNPGIVSLYLEARLVRDDVSIDGLAIDRLLDPATSVPTDLRNVLPLK